MGKVSARWSMGVQPGAHTELSSSTYARQADTQLPAEGVKMSTEIFACSIIAVKVSVECSGAKNGAMGTFPVTFRGTREKVDV